MNSCDVDAARQKELELRWSLCGFYRLEMLAVSPLPTAALCLKCDLLALVIKSNQSIKPHAALRDFPGTEGSV